MWRLFGKRKKNTTFNIFIINECLFLRSRFVNYVALTIAKHIIAWSNVIIYNSRQKQTFWCFWNIREKVPGNLKTLRGIRSVSPSVIRVVMMGAEGVGMVPPSWVGRSI